MGVRVIIMHMCDVVEDYIYQKKNVKISIDRMILMYDERQLNMLIDAFNHIQNEQ
jgi:ABC-type uncharacterized transport system ATPase component